MVQDSLVQGVSMVRDFHTKACNEYFEGLFKKLDQPAQGALEPARRVSTSDWEYARAAVGASGCGLAFTHREGSGVRFEINTR